MTNPAEGYESYMVPTLFAPWAARLIEAANPVSGERVLDVGCGTGIVARQVASRVGANGTVTGIDPNPNMLAVARTAAARDGVAIEWLEGGAEKLPFADHSFDVVLSQFALMFFTDKVAALAEMRRVGKDKLTVYFKRHYKDGTTRPARLAVNSFVESHIERGAELRAP